MPLLNGKNFADEKLLDAAGHILHAYYKAPQVTSRLDLEAVIVCGEELMPMLEMVEKMERKMGEAAKELFFPLYVDYMCLKVAIDQGYSPVIVLLGADATKANLQWDCGACGFPTCNEFNRYAKVNSGMGSFGIGPVCSWKIFDYGAACDYACAAAWELNVENRILGTFGLVGSVLEYIENVSATMALVLGPPKELWWYSRPSFEKWLDHEKLGEMFRKNYTNHYQMFSSKLSPQVKKDGAWWDDEPEFSLGIAATENYADKLAEVEATMMEAAMEVIPKVREFKQELSTGS